MPSGRVGSYKDAVFRSNDAFRSAVSAQEGTDVEVLQQRMGRSLDSAERARIGTGQLRRFLEQLLQRRRAPAAASATPRRWAPQRMGQPDGPLPACGLQAVPSGWCRCRCQP